MKYWNIESGELRKTFKASQHVGVESLTFSPDGKSLASAGLAVRLWESETGQPRFNLEGHLGATNTLAFTPDGRTIATGGGDGTIKLWDVARRSVRHELEAGPSSVQALAVSPDGGTLAAMDWGKHRIHMWDLATGEQRKTLEAEGDLGEALAFSPNGRWLASVTFSRPEGHLVTLWDLQAGRVRGRVSQQRVPRGSLLFSKDSKQLIAAGREYDGARAKSSVTVWDIESQRVAFQVEDPCGLSDLRAAALSPDGRTLALAGDLYGPDENSKSAVVVWDLRKRQPRLILDHARAFVQYMDFAPDGRSLLTLGFVDTDARIWDPRDGTLRQTIHLCEPGSYHVHAVCFAPDSRHFAAAMGNGTVYILRVEPGPANVAEVTRVPAAAPKVSEAPADLWKRLLNKPAPELAEVKGWVYGQPVRMADLHGRHVLLHFWNLDSEQALLSLMLLHEMFGSQDLAILVMLPDYGSYGATEEGWRKQFTESRHRYWGGREPPFRVAMDGGGETAVEGTQLKAMGATHALYAIPDSQRGIRLQGSTLLIDPDGKLVKRVTLVQSRFLVAEFEAILGKKATPPAWQMLFEQLYALGDGQVLRRVGPPFPPQRTDYLLFSHGSWALRGNILFWFDGKPAVHGYSGGDKLNLGEALNFVAGLKSYEIEGPPDLLKLDVSGDWIARKGAAPIRLVPALEKIVRDDLKQPIRIELTNVERLVLVAHGRYQYKPLTEQTNDGAIHLCVEPSASQSRFSGGGSGDLQEMLAWLGDRSNRGIVNEAEAPVRLQLRWRDHLASHVADLRSNTQAGEEKWKAVLDNLTKQTGLQFHYVRRQVPIWKVSKEKQ